MKKFHFLFFLFVLSTAILSCSTSKEARGYKKTISGSWQLQTVVTQGIMGKIKAEIFNEADFNCFIGSSWNFTSSNSLGSYTINNSNSEDCKSLKRDLRWSIYEPDNAPKEFQFKRLDNKLKEVDAGGGFRFIIVKLDENSMQLKSEFDFEGKPASFVYNFVRI